MKLALAIVAAASVAHADTMAMKRVESEDIHLADNQGAVNRRGDMRVDVELIAPAKLKVTAVGKRSDHNLYSNFSTDDVIDWKTTWTGTWTKRAGVLDLDLVLDADTCTRTKESSGAPTQKLACEPATKRAAVSCTTDPVEVEVVGAAKPVSRPAWRCAISSGGLGATPEQWVLGAPGCLKSIGSRSSLVPHFTSC